MMSAVANRKAPPVHRASRAPGKLVLLGEYAVLEGGPAWVTAVDRYATVDVLASETPRLDVVSDAARSVELSRQGERWYGGPDWALAADAYTAVFGDAPHAVRIDSSPFYLAGKDERLTKAGFGSSAAVVAALLALSGETDRETLFAKARAIHHSAQGNAGSGIDTAAAVFGGAFQYRISGESAEHHAVPLPEGLRIVPVWTGGSASTPEFLRRVVEWKASAASQYDRLIKEMLDDAAAGIQAAKDQDIPALLDIVRDYGRRMSQLGRVAGIPIVTPEMDDLAGLLADCAAVKPSGAGGGDIVLVFSTAEREPEVRRRLEYNGATTVDLRYGVEGCSASKE